MRSHLGKLHPASVLPFLALIACGGQQPPPAPETHSNALTASIAPSLGAAAGFALLAETAVTCTNATVTGNVGVYPGTVITQTSCPVTGTLDRGDGAAAEAQADFLTAYDKFAAIPCDQTLTTLDGKTLSPGVYCFDAAATSTGGVLTLNGPADGTWIFKIGTLGTGALTGTGFSVIMAGGQPVPCNSVYWWVAQAVTMTDSAFTGTILAGAAITLTRGTFNGDALSKVAVTVTGTAVAACAAGTSPPPPPSCDSRDFVTGGGFIGDKDHFAVAGGIKHGKLWGHLNYRDHARTGPDVKGTGVTAYVSLGENTRRILGTAQVNGRGGFTYQVDVTDNGEPGRNDLFSIRLSNGYSASGRLAGGGNIQLHKRHGQSCDDDDDDEGDDDHGGGHREH